MDISERFLSLNMKWFKLLNRWDWFDKKLTLLFYYIIKKMDLYKKIKNKSYESIKIIKIEKYILLIHSLNDDIMMFGLC